MDQDKLDDLFWDWAERLGIAHWELELVVKKIKPKTTTMRTKKSCNYNRGRVEAQSWILTDEPPDNWHKSPNYSFEEQIEVTIIHELLHLVFWDFSESICLLEDASKPSAFGVTVAVHEKQEEHMIDKLSMALFDSWHNRQN